MPLIIGTDASEQLDGSTTADEIRGLGGNDIIFALGGDDLVEGGDGNDSLDGGTGADTLSYLNAAAAVTVNLGLTTAQQTGGAGIDTIVGFENLVGSAFGDVLTGASTAVRNIIDGGAGDDLINGGSGSGPDTLIGGDGIDTVSYATAASRVTVKLALTVAQNTVGGGADTLSGFENVTGSAYNDTLSGNEFANLLTGGAGLDILSGLAGNDSLVGGADNDTLDGGAGDDLLDGGSGAGDVATYASATAGVTVSLLVAGPQDTLGAGVDTLTAIEGLTGSNHADVLAGNAGANSLLGGVGNDIIRGDAGNDLIDGGAGIDTVDYALVGAGITLNLLSQSAQNTVGAGSDTVRGIEHVIGTAFDDKLTGNDYSNMLLAGAGNDSLIGGLGNDTLDGGEGSDTASYASATTGVRVNLGIASAQYTLGAGTDTLLSVEHLIGSGLADVLTGNAADNDLTGGGGDDVMSGGLGNNRLTGGQGADTASYAAAAAGVTVNLGLTTAQNTIGAGTDTLATIENLTGSAFADTLTGSTLANLLTGGAGNDALDGGNGNDTLDGGAHNDVLAGGIGNDTVLGGTGDDLLGGGNGSNLLDGGAGFDTISYAAAGGAVTVSLSETGPQAIAFLNSTDTLVSIEQLIGSAFNDQLTGGATASTLRGGNGNDRLMAGTGNATLYGDDGSDILWGGTGIDTLHGGAGGDQLNGGAGDTLYGGIAGDTYYLADPSAKVMEFANEGVDRVEVIFDYYVIPTNVEGLYFSYTGLTGTKHGIGNDLDNSIGGHGGDDILEGRGGDDLLNGSTGNNVLIGGSGNDTYAFNNLGGAETIIVELPDEGIDDVSFRGVPNPVTGAHFVLPDNVENLEMWDYTTFVKADGNALDNYISARGTASELDGKGGQDVFDTRDGADRFIFSAAEHSTAAAPDEILAYASNDTIDLAGIDAIAGTPEDDAFQIVAAFTGQAGQLIFVNDFGRHTTYVLGDIDGDATADFGIYFNFDVTPTLGTWVL